MAIKLWSLVLIMMLFNPLHAEELECKGGSLFEKNRSFEFSKNINSNDEIYFLENIKKDNEDDFIIYITIKDFLITYMSLKDKKLGLSTDIFTAGFKGGSISSSKERDYIFITCKILD